MAGRACLGLLRRVHLASPADVPVVLAEEAAHIGADDVVIRLADHELQSLLELARPGEKPDGPMPIEGTLPGRAFATTSIVVADTATAGRRRLFLPLLDGTERLGCMEMTVDAPDGTVPEQLLMVAERYAHLAAQTIVTKSAYGDTMELVRRTRPMDVAAELIRSLLPPLVFATRDLVIAGMLEPAYEVGGDSFDYALNDRTLHVALFDAMGHGLPAAGHASFATAAYRSARRRSVPLADTYGVMDDAVHRQSGDRFVTAVFAELDVDTGRLCWVSAGHPPPLLVREGKFVKELTSESATPLGMLLSPELTTPAEESLQPGDLVLFYSDGLPEARLPDGEFFTVERLAEFIERQASAGLAAPETLRRLRHAVLAHQQGELQDDATAVLVEWRTGGEARLLPQTVLGTTSAGRPNK